LLPGGVVFKPPASAESGGGAALPLPAPSPIPTPPPIQVTVPASGGTDTGNGDAGDEIPLVSGPSDESDGNRGPLVPMAPRSKPLPPTAGGASLSPPVPPAGDTTVPAPAVPSPAVPAVAVPPQASPPVPATGASGTSALVPSVAVPAPAAVATETPPVTGRVYGGQHRESRVQIKATQDTWLQVRDASGDAIFTRVLHPGDVFRVPDRPGMRLRTGNAGGLTTSVDGGEAVPLGSVGQVLRDVPLDTGHPRAQ
jgi:hypothetical protein